ncbi:MAG: pentapeptide repeat-containing protein [Candidatus Bathyarchaeia archaeon]|jgi:uncharacterized protein YjbI with pentapeptide repeats
MKNDDRCVFHSDKKDAATFDTALRREISNSKIKSFDFTGAIFPEPGVDLTCISQSKPILFTGADFRGQTFFNGTTFGEVDFRKATFDNEVTFENAVFKRRSKFEGAKFTDASFKGATFEDVADFQFAKFDVGDFFDATFSKNVSFQWSELHDVSFVSTNFKAQVDFASCTMSGCDFDDATIAWQSFFDRAKLSDVSFEATTFVRPVSFDECIFSGTSKFTNTVFLSQASFRDVHGNARDSVLFAGNPADLTAELLEDSNGEPPLDDELRAELDNQKKIASIGHISLRLVTLSGADISTMQFLNVNWNSKSYGVWPFSRTRSAIFDEIQQEGSRTSADYESVAATYRQLRGNYEAELRYHEAGDFYVGEMEMRRLQLSCQSRFGLWRWVRRNILSILGWYRNISFYGESYLLSGSWIIGMILLFAMVHGVSMWNSEAIKCNSTINFRDLLSESLFAFFQLKSDTNLDLVERLIGAFLSGMLFIPLKRHFERR